MQDFSLMMLVQAASYVLLAPGVVGSLRWLEARFQGRRGPAIWQPYLDLKKLLLRKETNLPASVSWVFAITPPVVFACYMLLGFFVPAFFLSRSADLPGFWQGFDFIFVVYLLGLAKFVTGLSAFDTGAPFANMSAGRQFFLHVLAEPAFLITIYALVITGHSSNLLNPIYYPQQLNAVAAVAKPALALILFTLVSLFLAESGRLPFDNPGTHLELTMIELGVHLDYSGRGLALLELASAIKLTFFLSLLANFALPWGMSTSISETTLIAVLVYLGKLSFLIFALAFWEVLQTKMQLRMAVVPMVLAMVLALFAFIYMMATNYLF